MVEISARNVTVEVDPPDQKNKRFRKSRPYRLEDLPPEEGNTPPGRGAKTASSRGYDTERLVSQIFDGTTNGRKPWYDVRTTYSPPESEEEVPHLIECKSCIDEHPCGGKGSFRIWKKHHDRLVEAGDLHADEFKITSYVFLVYTVIDGQAVEIGKFKVLARWMDALIDEWQLANHDTMGREFCRDIAWTKLMKEIGFSLHDLRWAEVASPDPKNAPDEVWERFPTQ